MLWRLLQRSGVDAYRHGSDPWALVVFSPQQAAIGEAIGSDIVRAGFNVVILTNDLHQSDEFSKSLRNSFSAIQTDRKIEILTVNSEKDNSFSIKLRSLLKGKRITLSINCVNSNLAEESGDAVYPLQVDDFVQVQQAILPILLQNTPAADLVITCPASGSDFGRALKTETYFESFCSELNSDLAKLDCKDLHIKHMDCYAITSASHGLIMPSPSTLSASILRGAGHNSVSTIPYWPHEVWSWIIWVLLFLLPQKALERILG